MSLKWVDCDLPAPGERTPEQIRKNPASFLLPFQPLTLAGLPVANFQYSITKEVIWPLMELMQSASPSSYSSVLELDKKLRELSAAVNIYEDEQFNASAAAMEWNCILGAIVRQAGECRSPLFFFLRARRSRALKQTRVSHDHIFPFPSQYPVTWEWNNLY